MNINGMKHIILILLLCGLPSTVTFAQGAGITKQINDIKRDGKYFYAESTMETEEEAKITAVLMLTNYINDYINDNKLPPESKITEKSLTKAQYIKGKRGENMRVFVYVNKADFVPYEEKADDMALVSDVEPIVKPEPVVTPATTTTSDDTLVVTPTNGNSQVVTTPSGVVNTPPVTTPEPETTYLPEEKQSKSEPPYDASMSLPEAWQMDALSEMLSKQNLQGVVVVLNRLKVSYKVKRFGTYPECKNKEESFWIILDNNEDKSLITILGPGNKDRVNFRTRRYDSLDNYFGSGKGAVFFEFSK